MSRRIDIELTSARPDGSWTWRAAGAREPKGVVDGALVPAGAKAGAVFRAEADVEIDGLTITSVTDPKGRTERTGMLELLVSDKPFEAVTQQLVRGERGNRAKDNPAPLRCPESGGRREHHSPVPSKPRPDRRSGRVCRHTCHRVIV